MKLITKQLEKRFEKVGSQEKVGDPIIIAHFFNPGGAGDWYATEYDKANKLFFGFVSIFKDHNDEWGYFSQAELENFRGRFGLGIERDLHWDEQPISKIIK